MPNSAVFRIADGEPVSEGFETARVGEVLRVVLWGDLPPWWAGALSGALAEHQVSIVRGAARRRGALWQAELDVSGGDSARLAELDFVKLARAGMQLRHALDEMVLYEYSVSRSGGGLVEVTLLGADRIGFLSTLFSVLSSLALFPDAFRLSTRQGIVRDRFELATLNGRAPSRHIEAAVESTLARLQQTYGAPRDRAAHG